MTRTDKHAPRQTQLLLFFLLILTASPALAQSSASFDPLGAIRDESGTVDPVDPYVGCDRCALVRVGDGLWMRTACRICQECELACSDEEQWKSRRMIVDLSDFIALEPDFSCSEGVDDAWGQEVLDENGVPAAE